MKKLLLLLISLSTFAANFSIKPGYYDSVEDSCSIGIEKLSDGYYFMTYAENDTGYMDSWEVRFVLDSNSSFKVIEAPKWFLGSEKEIGTVESENKLGKLSLSIFDSVRCNGLELSDSITLGSK